MEYTYGDPEKAKDFIKNISEEDRVAIISHIDLDGIASAKVINKIINPEIVCLVNYNELESRELKEELKEKLINKIIMTDLQVSDLSVISGFEEFAEILHIDHHQYNSDMNSDKTIFIHSFGNCAAYIAYDLFVGESEFDNLKEIDWLVGMASLSDWMYEKNNIWLKEVAEKYRINYNIENPKGGEFWENVLMFDKAIIYFRDDLMKLYSELGDEIDDLIKLEKYSNIIDIDLADNQRRFEKDKVEIFDGYLFELKSEYNIYSFLSTMISTKFKNKNIFLVLKGERHYIVSARRQDGKYNLGLFLKEITSDFKDKNAGGHIEAAGASILISDYEEFKRRLMDKERFEKFRII